MGKDWNRAKNPILTYNPVDLSLEPGESNVLLYIQTYRIPFTYIRRVIRAHQLAAFL